MKTEIIIILNIIYCILRDLNGLCFPGIKESAVFLPWVQQDVREERGEDTTREDTSRSEALSVLQGEKHDKLVLPLSDP